MYKPYSLRTPPFEPLSGGIRAMYGLYGWLLAKGQIAFLNAKIEIPSIGIYPEIYHDNDMGSETVVRWILQKPGLMQTNGVAGPTKFPEDDLIYTFSKMYYDTPDDHVLYLPILNTYLFRDQRKKRTKRCVFVGDGINTGKHPDGCIEINRELCMDQQKLADTLNECEVMYGYEPVSAMYEIARLCGVRIVLFQNYWTLEQWRDNEMGMNGVSWGKDTGVKLDVNGFRLHYSRAKQIFSKRLDKFIEATQNA